MTGYAQRALAAHGGNLRQLRLAVSVFLHAATEAWAGLQARDPASLESARFSARVAMELCFPVVASMRLYHAPARL